MFQTSILRLTAPEICFSSVQRCAATSCDRMRYPTLFQTIRLPPVLRPVTHLMCAITTHYDALLGAAGKVLGKVKSAIRSLKHSKLLSLVEKHGSAAVA